MPDAVADQDQKPWEQYASQKPWELYGSQTNQPDSIDQEDQIDQPPVPAPAPAPNPFALPSLSDLDAGTKQVIGGISQDFENVGTGALRALAGTQNASPLGPTAPLTPNTFKQAVFTPEGVHEEEITPETAIQPGRSLIQPTGNELQPGGNQLEKTLSGFLTPGNLAAFPFAAAKPVQAMFLAQTAPAAVDAAKRLVSKDTPASQRGDAATDLLINAVMTHGLAHGLIKGGESDAIQKPSTTPVGAQPVGQEGAGVSGGQGVGSGDQGQATAGAGSPPPEAAPQVPLTGGTQAMDYSREDLQKYKDLKPGTIPKTAEEFSSPEFQANWKEFESLRNKYNGMPPRQLIESPGTGTPDGGTQIDVPRPPLSATEEPITEADFPKWNSETHAISHAGTDLKTGEPLYWVTRKVSSLKSAKSPTPRPGVETTKNGSAAEARTPAQSPFTVEHDRETGEHHIVNDKNEVVATFDNAAEAKAGAETINTLRGHAPQEEPFLEPEDQKHFELERQNAGAPVELTDDATSTHPFAQNAMAWIDRKKGTIVLNKDSLKLFLNEMPKADRRTAIRSVLAEENIHLHTDDASALTYWKNLSPWEQSIAKRRYSRGYDMKMADVNWGHEALRYRIQQLSRMTPTEMAFAVGKEKWTQKALSVVEHIIRNTRAAASLFRGRESRAILRRIQDNINAAREQLKGGGNLAAFRGRPKARTESKEQQGFILPGMESTRLAGSKIAASNIPGQEGAELPQTPEDVKAAGEAAVAAKVPQRPNAVQLGAISDKALADEVQARVEDAKAGKNTRLPNLKDFTADLKKQWGSLKPGEISDLWSSAVGKFIDQAPGEDLRLLGKSAFGGNVGKILTDAEINEKAGGDSKKAVELAKAQDRKLVQEGKKANSIWNAPVADVQKPGEGAIGDYQKAEIKLHELEQNLRNAIDGGDKDGAARIRSGIADIKHHILHKLKEPYQAALQRQKRRSWISSAIFRKMVKPDVADGEGVLNRKSVTPDDVRTSNDGKHSSYANLSGMPESKIAEALADKARRSSSDSATVTRRLAVLENKRTGEVSMVSAYDHPHGSDVDHDVRVLDPLSATRTHIPLTEALKRYKALRSVFLDQPVRKFRQDFSDVDEFNDKFGNQVEEDVRNAGRYSPDEISTSEFAQEAGGRISGGSGGSFQGPHRDLVSDPEHGAAEKAETTPLTGAEGRAVSQMLEDGGSPRNAADVKRVLQEMTKNKPSALVVSALRKTSSDIARDRPDYDTDAMLNALAHKVYENSIRSARTLEEGSKSSAAGPGEDARAETKAVEQSPGDQEAAAKRRLASAVDVTKPPEGTTQKAVSGIPPEDVGPMAFFRRDLESKRDDTLDKLGVLKKRTEIAYKQRDTKSHMAATIDGLDTVANNMGQQAEMSVRLESADDERGRLNIKKNFRGKKDILESAPAMLSAGGIKTIYKYDSKALAEVDRLLSEDPQFMNQDKEARAAANSEAPLLKSEAANMSKKLSADIQRKLIETRFLHHTDAKYVYSNDAKAMLDKFMADVNLGTEQAKVMRDRGNVFDKFKGRRWIKSNAKIMRTLEFAKAHWDNPEVRATARRIKMELDRQFDIERDNGYNISYDPEYLPGRYDGDVFSPGSIIFGGERILGKQFRKAAVFKNIYEAAKVGPYVPASLDGASLVGSRVRQGMRSVSRRMWWDGLKDLKDENGDFVAKAPKVGDFGKTTSPERGYVRFEGPGRKEIYIKDGYVGLVHTLVDPSGIQNNAFARGVLETNQFLKHTVLMADVFHLGKVTYYAGSIMGKGAKFKPGWAATAIREADLDRAVDAGIISPKTRDYLKEKVPFLIGPKADMISRSRLSELYERSGLNTGRIQDAIYKDLVQHMPGFGAYNRFLFDRFTTGMMKSSALKEFDRLSKLDPEKDSRQIIQESSKDLNLYFGSIGRQGWVKSRTYQDIANMGLLAPQWLEGLIKKELQPVKLITDPYRSITGRNTAFRGIARGMVSMLALTQVINMITRGTPTWQNEEKDHKWDAYLGDNVWLSPLAVFNELTADLVRLNGTKDRAWDVVQQIGSNKLGFMGRIASVLLTGKSPTGEYQSTTGGVLSTAAKQLIPTPISLGVPGQIIGHMLAPGTIQGVTMQQFVQKAFSTMGIKTHVGQDPVQITSAAAAIFRKAHGSQEPKIEFTDESTASKLRYQLKSGDESGAQQTLQQMRKTHNDGQIIDSMELWARRPFTSQENEQLFVGGMDDQGRKVYRQAMQQRYDQVNQFLQWYGRQTGNLK